jgi:hypothetical protein
MNPPNRRGWEHTLQYLDDFLAIILHSTTFSDPPNRYTGYFSRICINLGFRVQEEKHKDGHCIRFLGIENDTEAMEVPLPHEMHQKASAVVNSTLAQL